MAHAALSHGGPLHTGIGPSFFTKFLYFAGYDRPLEDTRRPLILDRNVERGIQKLCPGIAIDRYSTADYEAYLVLAHYWAERWDCQPDVVERVLFDIGRCSDLSVDVLLGCRRTRPVGHSPGP